MTQTMVAARVARGPQPGRRLRRVTLASAVIIAIVGVVAVALVWRATAPARSVARPASGAFAAGTFTHVPEAAFATQPPFTGSAVTKYGQPALQLAYRQAVNFAFHTGWDAVLIAKRHTALTSPDFAFVRSSLTKSCAAAYDALVAKALTDDKAAIRKLEGSTFFAVAGPGGAKPRDSAPAVTDRMFTRATVAVDTANGRQRLSVSFTAKAVVHLQDGAGKQYAVRTARAVRYLLVPNFGADAKTHPFLIDAWANHLQVKKQT